MKGNNKMMSQNEYRLRVSDIKMPAGEDNIKDAIARRMNITQEDIMGITIVKKSLDARKKSTPIWIITADVTISGSAFQAVEQEKGIGPVPPAPEHFFDTLAKKTYGKRPVIAGCGPSGLFAAMTLAKSGANPIIVEDRKSVV